MHERTEAVRHCCESKLLLHADSLFYTWSKLIALIATFRLCQQAYSANSGYTHVSTMYTTTLPTSAESKRCACLVASGLPVHGVALPAVSPEASRTL